MLTAWHTLTIVKSRAEAQQDQLLTARKAGGIHKAGEEAQDGEPSVDEVDEVGVLGLQIKRRQDRAAGRDGRRVEPLHQRHEAQYTQNPDELIQRGDRVVQVEPPGVEDDQHNLRDIHTGQVINPLFHIAF